MSRPLYEIAEDIYNNWNNVNYAAAPYLEAMAESNSIDDNYYFDTAKSAVIYFLANATTFRGEDARRIKAELKEMVK